jgi:hypothetical protein
MKINENEVVILAISYYFKSYSLFLIRLPLNSLLIKKIWTDKKF